MPNPLIKEWLAKADSDWLILSKLWEVPIPEIADGVCFHAQQCIEKLLKACMLAYSQEIPRTHDLVALSELLKQVHPSWSCELDDLRFLTKAAVDFRYPGDFAKIEDANEAVAICGTIRTQLLTILIEKTNQS